MMIKYLQIIFFLSMACTALFILFYLYKDENVVSGKYEKLGKMLRDETNEAYTALKKNDNEIKKIQKKIKDIKNK